jgi:hypothetical protein
MESGMTGFEDRARTLVATAGKIARLQGSDSEADVLDQSSASLVQTGSQDDWGETTDFYTLMLEVPIPTYAALDETRTGFETLIQRRLAELVRAEPGKRITEVVISPILAEEFRPPEPKTEEDGAEEEPSSFWQPGFFRLFISHTSINKDSAHRLKGALADYKVAAFVAHDDIEPTKEWEAEIERALRTMDAMSAIITPDFFESRWCDQEVGFAIGRGKLVVPICRDAIPHGFLGKYQGFKAKGLLPSGVAERLVDILIGHPLSADRMADALVERIATSKNWETSKRTMTLLEKATRLNNSQVTRLVQSIDANFQVGGAPRVAERIRALVSRIGKSAVA